MLEELILKEIWTSLNAPMSDTTLVSLLMWLTNSFGTGELKNTNALEKGIGGGGDQKHYQI